MAMDKKQKTLLVLSVAAFGFLGYQIYSLVSSDLSPTNLSATARPQLAVDSLTPHAEFVAVTAQTPETVQPLTTDPAPVAAATSNTTAETTNTSNAGESNLENNQQSTAPSSSSSIAAPPLASTSSLSTSTSTSASTSVSSQTSPEIMKLTADLHQQQQRYLQLVNQLQLAKMKRQLFSEEAAIADAQNRIARLNKETRQLGGNTTLVSGDANSNNNVQPVSYHLSYLDRQNGSWSAALAYKGHYQAVQMGTVLADGVRVTGITHQGVTLQDGDKIERVTFNGVVPLSTTQQPKQQLLQHDVDTEHHSLFKYHQDDQKQYDDQKQHAKWDSIKSDPDKPASKLAIFNAHEISVRSHVKPAVAKLPATHNVVNDPVSHNSKISDPVPHSNAVDPALNSNAVDPPHSKMISDPAPSSGTVSDPASQKQQSDPAKNVVLSSSKSTSIPSLLKNPAPTPAAGPLYSKNDQELLKLSPSHFTLQLVGSYHPFVIKDFILANKLSNKGKHEHYYIYYVYNGAGQRWNMLLYGDYSNIYFAQNALKHLAADMKTDDVVIRQLVDVQRDIRGRLDPV